MVQSPLELSGRRLTAVPSILPTRPATGAPAPTPTPDCQTRPRNCLWDKLLTEENIPTAKGRKVWQGPTLFGILRNPIYAGEYHALRRESVTPKARRGLTYGHSSSVALPEEQWVSLDFPVKNPVVSPAEWQQVQAQMKRNKAESQVNRNGFYMLSGMVFCSHDSRSWRGNRAGGGKEHLWYYRCTLGRGHGYGDTRCPIPKINGPNLEREVWDSLITFLDDPEKYMQEMARLNGNNTSALEDVEATISTLDGKVNKVYGMESELALNHVRGQLSDEGYRRAAGLLRAERVHYEEELERQQAVLATV